MKAAKRLLGLTARTRFDLVQSALTLVEILCAIARTELVCQDIEGVAAALQKARSIEALTRHHLDEPSELINVELLARLHNADEDITALDWQLRRCRSERR